VALSWSANGNPGATEYEISYATNDFVAFVSSQIASGVTSVYVSSLQGSTTYFFRVRSINGNGIPSSLDTTVSTITLPAAPTGVSGFALGVSSISWNWNAVTAAAEADG
jgi:hypothetical protein